MKTRIISIIMSVVLLAGMAVPAAAASASEDGNPFSDVRSSSYYHDAVLWTYNSGITTGTSNSTFSPNDTCTRGQVVTFLWRSLGSPEPVSGGNPFLDVSAGQYYFKPVLWAVEKGITVGTSDSTFSPNDTCTTAQVLTFLWRSCGQPPAAGERELADGHSGTYYADAIAWADYGGILDNTFKKFDPQRKSPRSEIVTLLYNNAGKPSVIWEKPDQFSCIGTLVKTRGSYDSAKTLPYVYEHKISENCTYSIQYLDATEPIIGFSCRNAGGDFPVETYLLVKRFSNSEIGCWYGIDLPSYGVNATGSIYDRASFSADSSVVFDTYTGPINAEFQETLKKLTASSVEELLVNTELLSFTSLGGFNSSVTIRDLGFTSAYKTAWGIR